MYRDTTGSYAMHWRNLIGLAAMATASLLVASAGAEKDGERVQMRPAPLEPKAALKSFQLLGGFRMELVAREPQVADPVGVTYDENGRAYVIDMRDYPYGAREAGAPLGRVL